MTSPGSASAAHHDSDSAPSGDAAASGVPAPMAGAGSGAGAPVVTGAGAASGTVSSPADDLTPRLTQADSLYDAGKLAEAEALLQPLMATLQGANNNAKRAQVQWRLGRVKYKRGVLLAKEGKELEAKTLYQRGLADVEASLALDDSSAQAHLWMSIMIAKVANTTKEKIQNAFKIKEHALKSTRLNPAGATAHHVLGEWAFGVASISFVERRVAAALFATPPTATYEEALQHYLNAEKASPGFYQNNTVRIVETLLQLSRPDEAKAWLKKAIDVVPSDDEPTVPKRIQALRKRLGV